MTERDKLVFFNKEDIESIVYFGYVNSDEQVFAENYDWLVFESGYKKIRNIN